MSAEGPPGAAAADDIRQCYRIILGREAESDAVVKDRVGRPRLNVIEAFLVSGEFGAQVFHPLVDGRLPATRFHGRVADGEAIGWVERLLADGPSRPAVREGDSGLAALAALTAMPAVCGILERHFGTADTTIFRTAVVAQSALLLRLIGPDEVALSLMCGPMLLGSLGRVSTPPPTVWDAGLADFARLGRLDDFAIAVSRGGDEPTVLPLPLPGAASRSEPLASRHRLAPRLRLVDLWFASRRELVLRFEGDDPGLTLDVWQCLPGDRPVRLVAAAPIGRAVAIVAARLLNPLAPVLLVFRNADGAIRMFDHVPFPSLARGGMHAAESAICGTGGDALSDVASLSADLLAPLLGRAALAGRTVAAIVADPAAETGIEPIHDGDLREYLDRWLGIAVEAATSDGPALLLPANAVPTLSALVRPLPPGARPQTVTGSLGLTEWDRQGAIRSVWVPPVGDWLDTLQARAGGHVAPMLRTGDGGPAALRLDRPLAIAVRPKPSAPSPSPFEIAAEMDLPLLRRDDATPVDGRDIVVLFEAVSASPLALLESLARQRGLGADDMVLVCRAAGTAEPAIVAALDGLFPGRGRVVELRPGLGRLEQLLALRPSLTRSAVLILDAATLLPDDRTLATLTTMLAVPEVASAGCLIRPVAGERGAARGGYTLTHLDLRAAPALGFAPADLSVLDAPVTLPVAANAMAAMLVRRGVIEALPPHVSDGDRPAEDDILLGLGALAHGHNLCTSVVSAYSGRPMPADPMASLALPYRLDARIIDRLVNATTVIQTIR